jgi:hypothetical protein
MLVDGQEHEVTAQRVIDEYTEVVASGEDSIEPGVEVLFDGREPLGAAFWLEVEVHPFEVGSVGGRESADRERVALAIDEGGGQRHHVRSRAPIRK